ncbi:hypothetical protein AAVH_24684, partial [Aphelenchoides avenae]
MPRFEVDYRGEQRVPLLVPDNATVQQMKELIAQRAHVHPTELQLIYSRRNLTDNEEQVGALFHDVGDHVLHAEY